jgi:hypothetical protein
MTDKIPKDRIERSRPVRFDVEGPAPSGLEVQLGLILQSLGVRDRFVRELHFDWCCEHPESDHEAMPAGFAVRCNACTLLGDNFIRGLDYHQFSRGRGWRFDYADVAARVGLEVDGGTWIGGRHVSGLGFEEDCRKLNEAALLGWRVFRFTEGMLDDGSAREFLARALGVEDRGG